MKRNRVLLAATAAFVTAVVGATSPGPQFHVVDRVLVVVFCIALAMALVTTLALIPSPRDPRRTRREMAEDGRPARAPGAEPEAPPAPLLYRDLGDPRRR